MTRYLASLLLIFTLASTITADRFSVEKEADKVTVNLDGKLFTEYLTKSGAKPVLWPVIGPNGEPVTRGFPMREVSPDEKDDHVHHRSFWFTHGAVNDTSFWHEGSDSTGNIVHREFLTVKFKVRGPENFFGLKQIARLFQDSVRAFYVNLKFRG